MVTSRVGYNYVRPSRGSTKTTIVDRFWNKVDKTPGLGIGDCWEWTAGISGGYGRFKLNGKMIYSHRFTAWQNKMLPSLDSELVVDHVKCQNKKCCNPDHLQILTASDHVAKTNRCERDFSGENNGRNKLTDNQVASIRERWLAGECAQQALADEYGITQQHVSKLVSLHYGNDGEG